MEYALLLALLLAIAVLGGIVYILSKSLNLLENRCDVLEARWDDEFGNAKMKESFNHESN